MPDKHQKKSKKKGNKPKTTEQAEAVAKPKVEAKGKEPVRKRSAEPPQLQTATTHKKASRSPRGKKSKHSNQNHKSKSPKRLAPQPSAPPLEDLVEAADILPSAPPLELLEAPPQPLKKSKSKINKEIAKILKKEDEKYPGINFDLPPADWDKEDKSKMREVLRTMSLVHKKQTNKDRVHDIAHQVMNSGPVETALAREIIGLLQKDTNLMNSMELKHVAFSTFSKYRYDWNKVAEQMGSKHTPAECKEYWYMDLYPRIKNMGFSEANDKQLLELAVAHKFQNWDKIADNIIGHTEYQCYVHFRRNLYKKMINDQTENEPFHLLQ